MDKQEHTGAATLLEVGLRAIVAARSSADLHTIRQVRAYRQRSARIGDRLEQFSIDNCGV